MSNYCFSTSSSTGRDLKFKNRYFLAVATAKMIFLGSYKQMAYAIIFRAVERAEVTQYRFDPVCVHLHGKMFDSLQSLLSIRTFFILY